MRQPLLPGWTDELSSVADVGDLHPKEEFRWPVNSFSLDKKTIDIIYVNINNNVICK